MLIIDANTGKTVTVGRPFRNVDGVVTVLKLEEKMFSAKALVSINGKQQWVDLPVRWTHPAAFLRKVAFISS